MFYRKDAVLMAIAGLLAANGYAMADTPASSKLSLVPTMITADAASERTPLMGVLDKAGAAQPLDELRLNIYGWIEAGYTYNNRHGSQGNGTTGLIPGPFNHEAGNHFMLNQVAIRFERLVATDKFDVGGLVDLLYGTDAAFTHSSGMALTGADPSSDDSPTTTSPFGEKYRADYEFDIVQAYAVVNLPVGSGLQLTIGKFVTLLGYETIDPRGNPFYSHSYIFGTLPFTQTGVLGTYQVNEQFKVIAGVTRGWDQTFEDSGPEGGECALDALGQFAYMPNKQLTILVNWSVGPQNFGDTSHYRTAIDPIVVWQVNDQLKLAAEGLYIYDGGLNGDAIGTGVTHAYGDAWGAAVYASYMINEYFTLNGRFEKIHYSDRTTAVVGTGGSLSIYSITLGTTITPLPKDPLGKNIMIRPEIRYDFSDSSVNPPYPAYGRNFKDQLTFGADVVVKF